MQTHLPLFVNLTQNQVGIHVNPCNNNMFYSHHSNSEKNLIKSAQQLLLGCILDIDFILKRRFASRIGAGRVGSEGLHWWRGLDGSEV